MPSADICFTQSMPSLLSQPIPIRQSMDGRSSYASMCSLFTVTYFRRGFHQGFFDRDLLVTIVIPRMVSVVGHRWSGYNSLTS